MPQLYCRDLTLGYGGRHVVEGLNFEVNDGDYLAVVGENGSGKSTLMKAILHLHAPISGTLSFGEGLDRRSIGYLPQQTELQRDFPASVFEVVLSGALARRGIRPFYRREDKVRALSYMEKLDVLALKDRSYRELSGGQQQRVLLARALTAADRMLVLDEPVAGLDPQAAEEMYRVIDALHGEGVTVIMVSHDMTAALGHATHVLHVGTPIFFGTRDEYVAKERGARYGLD